MINNGIPYHLVHIVGGGEHKTPLVASQVFDRAQVQATTNGKNKPLSVSVWIIVPMRMVFEKQSNKIIKMLRKRCPNIEINIIAGINRLKNWPAISLMKWHRNALNNRVVYHCRGEILFNYPFTMQNCNKADAVVLDIRGFFPLERFINNPKIKKIADMNDFQKQLYEKDLTVLNHAIINADMVTTVSTPLQKYLIDNLNANVSTTVIPCCVKNIVSDTKRSYIRQLLGIEDKIAILYLGGTQKAQYLEELVIPFIKSAITFSVNCVGVFITQDKNNMLSILSKFNINQDSVRVISVPQTDVGEYLSGMDLGVLLRAPSIQNNFSQPVKFGEYLSAGIPVVLEEGTGDIASLLAKYNIGEVVKLSDKTTQLDFDKEVQKAINWYEMNKNEVRDNARNYVDKHYTWEANVPLERNMYIEALLNREVKNKTITA